MRIDSRAAEDMIADLAEILRASFADTSTQETTVQRELDLVACYLRIQQRRFGDRPAVHYRIEADVQQAAIPSLFLQSLVENAMIHGVAPLTRHCTIEICAEHRGTRLELQVLDDGAGMQPGRYAGLGLANARRRLRELYGAEHAVNVSNAPGGGVLALVSIPYHSVPSVTAEVFSRDNTSPDCGRRSARPARSVVSVGS